MEKQEKIIEKSGGRFLTKFLLLWDTPFTDFNNTIHFSSNTERNNFFWDGAHYSYLKTDLENYNFVKTRQTVRIEIPYDMTNGLNYLSFYSDFDNKYYYAYILEVNYINDNTCEIKFVIDTIMTFTQGNVLNNLKNVKVQRQHLSRNSYNLYLPILRNNDDILKANTKMYKSDKFIDFGANYVLFESSADLSADFGSVDDPKLKSSGGSHYDKIVGATKIYIVAYENWSQFLGYMRTYPWITQNFNKIKLIPKSFIDIDDLVQVEFKNTNLDVLFTLKFGATSKAPDLSLMNYSYSELQNIVTGNDNRNKYKHLVRNEYLTIEIYDMQGNSLFLDSGKLDEDTGLLLKSLSIIGYDNNIKIYPHNYNHNTSETSNVGNGSFLTQSLTINTFTELPIFINSGELSKANQANQRNLAESKLVTNRMKDFANGGDTIADKLADSISVGVDVAKGKLWGRMNDEYNFYEQQKADYKDMALQTPTITSSSMGNAFLIANDLNGILLKISAPSTYESSNIKRYYDTFGFELDFESTQIDDIHSMTIMNYLKISGNYLIEEMPIYLYDQLRATLEMGVKFWHNNNSANPFIQKISDNDFRN